jgi:hypothetical protein
MKEDHEKRTFSLFSASMFVGLLAPTGPHREAAELK